RLLYGALGRDVAAVVDLLRGLNRAEQPLADGILGEGPLELGPENLEHVGGQNGPVRSEGTLDFRFENGIFPGLIGHDEPFRWWRSHALRTVHGKQRTRVFNNLHGTAKLQNPAEGMPLGKDRGEPEVEPDFGPAPVEGGEAGGAPGLAVGRAVGLADEPP